MADEAPKAETVAKADYDKAMTRAQNFEAQLRDKEVALEKYKGIDPTEHSALKEELALLRKESTGGDQKKIDELLAKTREDEKKRYSPKIDELTATLTEKEKRLNYLEVVTPAMEKIQSAFNDDQHELMKLLVERDLFRDGDEIKVKGENGKALPSKADPRKDMTLEEYVDGLKEKYVSSVRSTQIPGARTGEGKRTNTGGKELSGAEWLAKTPAERAQYSREDQMKYGAAALGMNTRVSTVKLNQS